MKNRIGIIAIAAAALISSALAQPSPSPFPLLSPVEKDLAARAANVTEVTLGKGMLDFAARFMDGKDKDQAAVKQLIDGLDGIYVRDYEFDKEGQFSAGQIEQLRKYFETSEWSPLVRDRDSKTGESSDVMVKLVNGQSGGLFILDVEPKEISIVLILGPIRMDQLGELKGLSGLGALGNVDKSTKSSEKPGKGGSQ